MKGKANAKFYGIWDVDYMNDLDVQKNLSIFKHQIQYALKLLTFSLAL